MDDPEGDCLEQGMHAMHTFVKLEGCHRDYEGLVCEACHASFWGHVDCMHEQRVRNWR